MALFLQKPASFAGSVLVNGCFLLALSLLLVQGTLPSLSEDVQLESLFAEELPQEEITRELDANTSAAVTLNYTGGGTSSTAVGASVQPTGRPVNVQKSAVMKEVGIRPVMTDFALPSDALIGAELGEGEITGEVGSMVEGYGAAMGIITQEIIRMMREQKVTLIWLFDESGSMEDDRKEIRENYLRVYEELGIATAQDEVLRRGSEPLLTVVASYGKDMHEHTLRPTADGDQIKAAIDKVVNDTSGQENLCQSIAAIIAKHQQSATRGRRKLAVIVVSDESGDDGEHVETAVSAARAVKAPLYFLGRESMFGFPYSHQRWIDEPTGEHFWIRIRRGPETPYPECLQWNGLHSRWDVQSSGFGPYEQVRMARETGGIFFVLPGDEETLTGEGANDKRKYDFLSMREYQPNLDSRPEYVRDRAASELRETVWQVISRLNPNDDKLLFQMHDPELNIQHELLPLELEAFRTEAIGQVNKAAKAMSLTLEAISLMEKARSSGVREPSQRWRASYELATAQLYMFRLRLFQFLLAMDQHANNMPKPQDPKSNRWSFWWNSQSVIVPDEAQYKRLADHFGIKLTREEYLEMVKTEEAGTIERLRAVITDHPGTPWARRAETEIGYGFGFLVRDVQWNPSGRYNEAQTRVPNL